MDTQTPTEPAPPKGYISLPPEVDEPTEKIFTAKFVIFAVLVIAMATVAGLLKSGHLSLNKYFNTPPTVTAALAHTPFAPAATPVPIAPLSPAAVAVTSISLGQQSFAIINGNARMVGDAIDVPGVTGWKVKQITDGAVVFQNGSTISTIPLTSPGLNKLDDTLHPLN
jgi:hypothetical protein